MSTSTPIAGARVHGIPIAAATLASFASCGCDLPWISRVGTMFVPTPPWTMPMLALLSSPAGQVHHGDGFGRRLHSAAALLGLDARVRGLARKVALNVSWLAP